MPRSLLLVVALLGCTVSADAPPPVVLEPRFQPGQRSLVDAHNAYPQHGRYADRLDLALGSGTPLAIEQDLFLRRDGDVAQVVVAHDSSEIATAPTLETYFFRRVATLMERALVERQRNEWPLIVLNLDFKVRDTTLYAAVWNLLGRHEHWLTTVVRDNADSATALDVGPLLVLTGTDSTQRAYFHDRVPVGQRLRLFGALPVPAPPGRNAQERARNVMGMPAEELIGGSASAYVRWVNFPWHVVEAGGPQHAAEWTEADSTRLASLVTRAHQLGLWIRFYTLDGFTPATDRGYIADYNFGSLDAAGIRWRAARTAGVDFIATDQVTDTRKLWD